MAPTLPHTRRAIALQILGAVSHKVPVSAQIRDPLERRQGGLVGKPLLTSTHRLIRVLVRAQWLLQFLIGHVAPSGFQFESAWSHVTPGRVPKHPRLCGWPIFSRLHVTAHQPRPPHPQPAISRPKSVSGESRFISAARISTKQSRQPGKFRVRQPAYQQRRVALQQQCQPFPIVHRSQSPTGARDTAGQRGTQFGLVRDFVDPTADVTPRSISRGVSTGIFIANGPNYQCESYERSLQRREAHGWSTVCLPRSGHVQSVQR